MPYDTAKAPGDLIRAADWNELAAEVRRLDTGKLDRAGNDAVAGPLAVRGDLTVGAPNAGASLRVTKRQEDGSDPAHGALVVGTDSLSSASLRIGYGSGYSWLQGQGRQALAINPRGGEVGVGTDAPKSPLSVAGGVAVGAGWAAGVAAPAGGLIVEGNLGVGVPNPAGRLEVGGDVVMGGPAAGQRFLLHTRVGQKGDFLQLTVDGADGGWDWSKGITLQRASGNVGVGTTQPAARLEVGGAAVVSTGSNYANRNGFMAPGSLTVGGIDANFGGAKGWGPNTAGLLLETAANTEIAVHDSGTRVASLMYYEGDVANRITIGRDMGWGGVSKVQVQSDLHVTGQIYAPVVRTGVMAHRMYPADAVVYQDLIDARNAGAFRKFGSPNYDDTSYAVNGWFERRLVRFGGNNEADANGVEVIIPPGYDTAWVRVLGDRWAAFNAFFRDGSGEGMGVWTGGFRSANGYCPDGSLSDGYNDRNHGIEGGSIPVVELHQWVPVPARRAGTLALVPKPHTNWDFWVSGLAFSRNPWAHAAQSAVGYHWNVNGGRGVTWNSHDWNQDVLATIPPRAENELIVPVVPSARDKLLYLVEHNNNWNGTSHGAITVNGRPVERFLSTWDNPFARHWNSKMYARYIAARIPADVIGWGAERYIRVQIDMRRQNQPIHFREIGTHDLEPPIG